MTFPVDFKGSAAGAVEYSNKKFTLVYDEKTIPKCSSRTEPVGHLRTKKFALYCDGNGKFKIKEILSVDERIVKLDGLRKKGLISEEDYESTKTRILGEL